MTMIITQALREANIRTQDGRACPCCLRITGKDARRIRRAQRRREGQAWRRDARDDA